MQYAPTHTVQKIDSLLSIELPARYILGRMQYAHTLTDQKNDSPLKSLTINDPFLVYRCRGVWHTPHKCPWQWANDSFAGYVSVEYVLIESFSCQEFDSLSFIESYTRQKFDSPLKPPTRKDPFFVYPCRGVLHTPLQILMIMGKWFARPVRFGAYAIRPYPDGSKNGFHCIYWIVRPAHSGAYAIRPYPDGSKNRFPFIHWIKNPIRLGLHSFTIYPFPARNP